MCGVGLFEIILSNITYTWKTGEVKGYVDIACGQECGGDTTKDALR